MKQEQKHKYQIFGQKVEKLSSERLSLCNDSYFEYRVHLIGSQIDIMLLWFTEFRNVVV